MIAHILAWFFPPALGRIRHIEEVMTRYRVETGELRQVVPDPPGCWAGNVREWSNGRWRRVTPRY